MKKKTEQLNNDLSLIQEFLEKTHREKEEARYNWNKAFPPDAETDVNDGMDKPTRYGIWKVEDGVMIIAKSKNGYHPEKGIIIFEEILKAIQRISI